MIFIHISNTAYKSLQTGHSPYNTLLSVHYRTDIITTSVCNRLCNESWLLLDVPPLKLPVFKMELYNDN